MELVLREKEKKTNKKNCHLRVQAFKIFRWIIDHDSGLFLA